MFCHLPNYTCGFRHISAVWNNEWRHYEWQEQTEGAFSCSSSRARPILGIAGNAPIAVNATTAEWRSRVVSPAARWQTWLYVCLWRSRWDSSVFFCLVSRALTAASSLSVAALAAIKRSDAAACQWKTANDSSLCSFTHSAFAIVNMLVTVYSVWGGTFPPGWGDPEQCTASVKVTASTVSHMFNSSWQIHGVQEKG